MFKKHLYKWYHKKVIFPFTLSENTLSFQHLYTRSPIPVGTFHTAFWIGSIVPAGCIYLLPEGLATCISAKTATNNIILETYLCIRNIWQILDDQARKQFVLLGICANAQANPNQFSLICFRVMISDAPFGGKSNRQSYWIVIDN